MPPSQGLDARLKSRSQKIQPHCATPGCKQESGHGYTRRFCVDCAARLAGVHDQLKAEGHNMHRAGLDPAARKKAKGRTASWL